MAATFTDAEIRDLVRERKRLPQDWRRRTSLRPKRGHEERNLDLIGEGGNRFRLILRRSRRALLDFSAGLAVFPRGSNKPFRLRRYNGKHHWHRNEIEGNRFYAFHIHEATERYQERGLREDGYAEPTDRYDSLAAAIRCLLEDANLIETAGAARSLFDTPRP